MINYFQDLWALALLALIPLIVIVHLRLERVARPRVIFSDLTGFKQIRPGKRVALRRLPLALRGLALGVLILALARPQHGNQEKEILSKGIDITVVLDISGSMREPDIEPSRLEAAKKVVDRFIDGRAEGLQNDRIGLVAFARVAFTKCPLTVDYVILKKIVDHLANVDERFDGTAIGTAIATAVARMEDSKAKSKVIVLVTDGLNNNGLDPLYAASLAKAMGIKVYPIGVVPKASMVKIQDPLFGAILIPSFRNQVDESQMREIAMETGGQYFSAEDEQGLRQIFDQIDRLERTEVKVKEFYRYQDRYPYLVVPALIYLLLELLLARTALRTLP